MADYLDKHSDTDLISMGFDFIDENDNFLYTFESLFKYNRCQQALILGCNVGAAFMYRKTIADKVGGYDINTFCAEDYDYWCRIALVGKIDYQKDNIYVYRYQPNSLTSTKQAQIQEKTKYIQRKYATGFFEKFGFTKFDKIKFYSRVLHESHPKYRFTIFGINAYRFIIKLFCCFIIYPANLRHKIRSKLLPFDKFSFSTSNKEYYL